MPRIVSVCSLRRAGQTPRCRQRSSQVLWLPGDSRSHRCRCFLPPVTGNPQQRHPVHRIAGAFGSIGALPRIVRIQLSQRHRRYSLSRAQHTLAPCTRSLTGRCDVRHTTHELLHRRLSAAPGRWGATIPDRRPGLTDWPGFGRTFLVFPRIARTSLLGQKQQSSERADFSGCPRSGPPASATTSHDNAISSVRKDRGREVDARTPACGPPRDPADHDGSLDAAPVSDREQDD